MQPSPLQANPFAMLTHPEAVMQAIEESDRLNRLHRRVCRPLDKPLAAEAGSEQAEFDAVVDGAAGTDL